MVNDFAGMKMKKPILSLDFDGVIHTYASGWMGPRNIPDLPVPELIEDGTRYPGALEFITQAVEHFQVCIFSSRSRYIGGRWAMKRWLKIKYWEISGVDKDDRWRIPTPPDEIPEWWYQWVSQTAFADPWDDEVRFAIHRLMKEIKWPVMKPPAHISIDDRGYCFDGRFPDAEGLLKFKPWNK